MNKYIFELDLNDNQNNNINIKNIEKNKFEVMKKSSFFNDYNCLYNLSNNNNENISFLLKNVNSKINSIYNKFGEGEIAEFYLNNFKYIADGYNIKILFNNNIINLNLDYKDSIFSITDDRDTYFHNTYGNSIDIMYKHLSVVDENDKLITKIYNYKELLHLLNKYINNRVDFQINILLYYDCQVPADIRYEYYFLVTKIKIYEK